MHGEGGASGAVERPPGTCWSHQSFVGGSIGNATAMMLPSDLDAAVGDAPNFTAGPSRRMDIVDHFGM